MLTKTVLSSLPIFLPSLQEQEKILQEFQIVYNTFFKSEVIYNDFLLNLMKKYLEIGDLLFQKYKDSQIKIKDRFKLVRGKTPPTTNKEYYQNGTIKWINSGVLTNLYFLTNETPVSKQITEKAAKECQIPLVIPNIMGTGIYNFIGNSPVENAVLFFALRNARKEIIKKICLKGATQFTSIRGSELINFPLR
ncbi:2571_t:CDS:2, partial [Funneliformis geosporum]